MSRPGARVSRIAGIGLAVLLLWPAAAAASSRPARSPEPIPAAAPGDPSAIELRVLLGQLLGEHAFLLLETLRATTLNEGDRVVLRGALDDNSAQLSGAVGAVYGEDAASGFSKLWDLHIDLLVDYAEARRTGDAAAAEAARDGLDRYTQDFASFLATANPSLDAADEAAALRLHVEQVTTFADADYARAYEAQREAFGHMFELGDHLALGIARQFPDRFAGAAVAFSPRSDLRLALDRLLAEHFVLAAEAMKAGVRQAADFDASATALGSNTDDLSAAVGGVYGSEAGAAFKEVWGAHVEAYLSFVQALGAGDESARASSLEQLHAYHDQLADFLSTANPHLRHDDVADLIRLHVQALISQAEATAAGDDARAVATTREGYAGTFRVGAALAEAIAKQFPDRYRDLKELPPTSTLPAPSAHHDPRLLLALAMAVAAVMVAAWSLAAEARPHRS